MASGNRSYMFNDRTQENRRKEREEAQVEIRQQKKEELLNKKRNLSFASAQISNFPEMSEKLYSEKLSDIFQGAYEFRSLLSIEGMPPIQAVIDAGCLPRFVQLLDKNYLISKVTNDEEKSLVNKVRVESAWVITNIAAGTSDQTKAVVEAGSVNPLVHMLLDENDIVVDQSVWALGNIAGDSEVLRDKIIATGSLDIIVNLLEKYYRNESMVKVVRNLTWLLSNLNRGRNPKPSVDNMKKSLSVLFNTVNCKDPEVVCDSFWAISYIVDVDSECTDIVLGSSIMGRAHNFLTAYTQKLNNQRYASEDAKIGSIALSPIIRMLGNIATGNDTQTNIIVSMGFLGFLPTLFYKVETKKAARLRKEICWTVSNITAGPVEQVRAVFNADLMPMLIDAISSSENFVRKEACWALSNALFHCSSELEWIGSLINYGLIEGLLSYLEVITNLPEMQVQILECLKYALECGKKFATKFGKNIVMDKIIELDCVSQIENLQDSDFPQVSDKAYHIIVEYFEGVDS